MTTAEPHSGPAAQGSDGFSIVRVAERHQYELRDGDLTIGFAKYREQPGRITFTHTVVDSAYEGRGLGSRIARHVLDEAVANKLRIVPVCPFIAAYLRRHHDYDASIDWPVTDVDA